ncbi:MAG TPA: 16S rRNA (uracil(1498)-N(3))-methyltransferase, partial [Gemmatimonadaceae bacterium]
MERTDRASLATFFAADEPLHHGAILSLGPSVVRHLRALRQGPGHTVRLTDGSGRQAIGTVVRLSHETVSIQISDVEQVAPLPPIHLLVPIGDRERMLWLAEKVTELGVTTWRPVLWRHSKSVRPRGEGPTFALKARARMISALEQSRGAYLPLAHPEAPPERAVAAVPEGQRIVLDPAGAPLLSQTVEAPVT